MSAHRRDQRIHLGGTRSPNATASCGARCAVHAPLCDATYKRATSALLLRGGSRLDAHGRYAQKAPGVPHFIKRQQIHKDAFGVHPIRAVLVETTDERRARKLMELAGSPPVI